MDKRAEKYKVIAYYNVAQIYGLRHKIEANFPTLP